MTRIFSRFISLAALAALFVASTAPAYATNPRSTGMVSRHGGVILARGQAVRDSVNGLLNSDMAIYVSNGSTYTSLAAEGHLILKPKSGAAAGTYTGKFVDDLGGAAVYAASGTNVSPTTLNGHYVVKTFNGTFTFTVGGSFVSTVPKKYGPKAAIGTILYGTHIYTIHPPLAVTIGTFTIGAFLSPVMGA